MRSSEFYPFLFGFLTSIGIGAAIQVLIGMKFKLYLLSHDGGTPKHHLIPITAELKKRSLIRTLYQKGWNEDLDITLTDQNGVSFVYQIKYDIWRGFLLKLKTTDPKSLAKINGKPIMPDRSYKLRTGTSLESGESKFSILISLDSIEKLSHKNQVEGDRAFR